MTISTLRTHIIIYYNNLSRAFGVVSRLLTFQFTMLRLSGNVEAVKQHLAAGTDVNAKGVFGVTPLCIRRPQ